MTDNGGFILDADFGVIADAAALEARLRQVVGIVETGLFIDMASAFYVGQADGSFVCKTK